MHIGATITSPGESLPQTTGGSWARRWSSTCCSLSPPSNRSLALAIGCPASL